LQKTLFFGLSKGIVIVLILAVIETPCFFQIAKASPLIDNIKPQQPSIQICCSWGKELADGVLTYKIIGGDALTQMAVRNAINEWNVKVKGIEITEVTGNTNADIEVNFNLEAHKIDHGVTAAGHTVTNAVTAAQSTNNLDENGFISSVLITISRSAFGDTFDSNKIKQLTQHEIGHALGLGHTNFNGDLMSVIVDNNKTGSISKCDIDAILEANQWKVVDSDVAPYHPQIDRLYC
jgi:predicted Zn-dependent protease